MQNVLVTGGAGFIGSHIAKELTLRGYKVRVLDNFFRGKRDNLAGFDSNIEIIEGDISDLDTMKKAVINIDTVFHLASVNGTEYFYKIPDTILSSSTRGMLNLIDALAEADVERVVYASTAEVYGIPQQFPTPEDHPLVIPNPRNARWSYSESKILGEMMLLHNATRLSISPVILRYHNTYGPHMGWKHVISEFLYRMLTKEPFTIQGTGEETRSFCYISDSVEMSIRAALYPTNAEGEILNIGNSSEININNLVTILEEITSIHVERQYIPFPQSGTSRRVPDITKARHILKYSPEVSLYNGLTRTYEWCRKALAMNNNLTLK